MGDAAMVIVAIAAAVCYLLWLARRRLTGRASAGCHGQPRSTRVRLTLGGQPIRKR